MNEIAIIFSGERVAFHGFDEWSFPATAARMRIWAEGAAKAIADYQSEILHIHNEKVDACVRATAAEAELEAIKQGQLRDAGNVPDHRNDLVPGELHCAKCKFRLSKRVLNMQAGTVHCGTSKTEPCPNGCGLLWPITWEQEAREGYLLVDQLFNRAIAAEESCRKLTAELNAQNGPTFMGKPVLAAQPVSAQDAKEGYQLMPIEPTHEIISAMNCSKARDDEGEFPMMVDLLDYSGENKAHTALKAAYAAAIAAQKEWT